MANPTWFNAKDYLANKLEQLKATDAGEGWTTEDLTKAMEKAGYTGDEGAYKHFNDFGMNENVSPNATFNVSEYLAAKVAQLNLTHFEGKTWSEATLMKAITDAGMKSAWEHFDKYGSQEGINPSNSFDTNKYFLEKTNLMNQTKEGGRADWTVDQVKAAFDAAGLNVVEHYNLFGEAEFKAFGTVVDFKVPVDKQVKTDGSYDPYTGVKTYDTLVNALAAQKDGTLAVKYTITDVAAAGEVTVAQQAGLKDFLAKASPAITDTPAYTLEDTVANIGTANGIVLANSSVNGTKGLHNILDTIANVAAGDDGVVNLADTVTANVAFGAKAAVDASGNAEAQKAEVVTTKLKYSDIDGKNAGEITLAKAADDTAEGDAVIVIDATTNATALTTDAAGTATSFAVDDANSAFAVLSMGLTGHLTYQFVGSAKGDVLTAGTGFTSINAGAGADTVIVDAASTGKFDGGAGTDDTLQITATRSFTAGQISNFEKLDLGTTTSAQVATMAVAEYAQFKSITNTTGAADGVTFSDAATNVNLLSGDKDGLVYTLGNFANTVTTSAAKALTINGGTGVDTIDGHLATTALTITGGKGADHITLAKLDVNTVDIIRQTAVGDSDIRANDTDAALATASAVTAGTVFNVSGADVVKGAVSGDKIALGATMYSGAVHDTTASEHVFVKTVKTDTLADNSGTQLKGTYDSVAGTFKVLSSGGADSVFIYDANSAVTGANQDFEAIVLVGFAGTVGDAIGGNGADTLLTLSA